MTLLSMSLSGGCIILAAALLRALARDRLPVWSFEALWALAWLRLMEPVRLPWRWSLWSALARLAPANAGPALAALPGTAAAMPGGAVDIISEFPPAAPSMSPWTAVWLAGAAALAAGYGLLWLWWRRRFRAGSTVETGAAPAFLAAHPLKRRVCVRRWARPEAPLTYGLFRPVILLGDSAPWQDEGAMDCVLAHELAHIRRLDGARRALLWLAVCVHWFDPLVWLMAALACRDMERACDRAALAMLGREARKDYARALLDMAGRRAGLAPAAGFSKNAIEERIHSIMKTRKTTLLSGLLSLALVLALGAAFATSAAASEAFIGGADGSTSITVSGDTPIMFSGDVAASSDGTVTVYDDEGQPIEMTREGFEAFLDPVEVEWWTAEEYAAWLEQEKKDLQDCLGQRAWTNTDGWFTWTQEKIDEAIAMYEQTLKDIQNGLLVSKTVGGSADVMLAQGSAPAAEPGTGTE